MSILPYCLLNILSKQKVQSRAYESTGPNSHENRCCKLTRPIPPLSRHSLRNELSVRIAPELCCRSDGVPNLELPQPYAASPAISHVFASCSTFYSTDASRQPSCRFCDQHLHLRTTNLPRLPHSLDFGLSRPEYRLIVISVQVCGGVVVLFFRY